MPRILFLYDQLNGYTDVALRELARRPRVELLVVANPNALAPFSFESVPYHVLYRNQLKAPLLRIARDFDPDAVFVSGWAFRDYLAVAARLRTGGATTVCMADNKWENRWRQRLLAPTTWPVIRGAFTYYWGAGISQYELARRLHFPPDRIRLGLYACDHQAFSSGYADARTAKRRAYPRRLLYVGRFSEEKGVLLLYDTVRSLLDAREMGGWTLTMVGGGPLTSRLPAIDGIDVRPFVQPRDLIPLIATAGCFVMPSHREQWGVAVQEFAAAGMPLICSSAVGATSAFLRPGFNGYEFVAGQASSLRSAIEDLTSLDDDRLLAMGDRSHALSFQNTPEIWANTALSLLTSS